MGSSRSSRISIPVPANLETSQISSVRQRVEDACENVETSVKLEGKSPESKRTIELVADSDQRLSYAVATLNLACREIGRCSIDRRLTRKRKHWTDEAKEEICRNKLLSKRRLPVLCSASGNLGSLKYLVENKANVSESKDEHGWTALAVAARGNHSECAKFLLRNNCNPNEPSIFEFTPIHIALNYRSQKIVRILIEAKANVGHKLRRETTPLMLAIAQSCSVDLIKELLNAKADPHSRNSKGITALMIAAAYGRADVIKMCTEKEAFEHRDNLGRNIEGWARGDKVKKIVRSKMLGFELVDMARKGDKDRAKEILCLTGVAADLNVVVGADRRTPLLAAAEVGWDDVVEMVIAQKEKVEERMVPDTEMSKALLVAATEGHLDTCKCLFRKYCGSHGSPAAQKLLRKPVKKGFTILMAAAYAARLDVVQYLVEKAKAPVENTIMFKGNLLTAAGVAERSRHHSRNLVSTYLRSKEKEVITRCIKEKNGENVLQILRAMPQYADHALRNACILRSEDLVRALVEFKANVNSYDEHGRPTLAYAAHNENLLRFLLEAKASIDGKRPMHGTALMYKAGAGDSHGCTNLLKYKADITVKLGALHVHEVAAEKGHSDLASLLKAHMHYVSRQKHVSNGLSPTVNTSSRVHLDVPDDLPLSSPSQAVPSSPRDRGEAEELPNQAATRAKDLTEEEYTKTVDSILASMRACSKMDEDQNSAIVAKGISKLSTENVKALSLSRFMTPTEAEIFNRLKGLKANEHSHPFRPEVLQVMYSWMSKCSARKASILAERQRVGTSKTSHARSQAISRSDSSANMATTDVSLGVTPFPIASIRSDAKMPTSQPAATCVSDLRIQKQHRQADLLQLQPLGIQSRNGVQKRQIHRMPDIISIVSECFELIKAHEEKELENRIIFLRNHFHPQWRDVGNSEKWSLLNYAIVSENDLAVKVLLENKASPLVPDQAGRLPIIQASMKCNSVTMRLLLKYSASPNVVQRVPGTVPITALMLTCEMGWADGTEFLIAQKAFPNVPSQCKDVHPPLFVAAAKGHGTVVNLLLNLGAHLHATFQGNNISQYLEMCKVTGAVKQQLDAARETLSACVCALSSAAEDSADELNRHLYLNFPANTQPRKFLLGPIDSQRHTLLMTAAKNGKINMLRALIAARADPKIQSEAGADALYEAIMGSHFTCVVELLHAKADINTAATTRAMAHICSQAKANMPLLNLLLCSKADPNASTGPTGKPLLVYAAKRGRKSVVLNLMKAKADPTLVYDSAPIAKVIKAEFFMEKEVMDLLKEKHVEFTAAKAKVAENKGLTASQTIMTTPNTDQKEAFSPPPPPPPPPPTLESGQANGVEMQELPSSSSCLGRGVESEMEANSLPS